MEFEYKKDLRHNYLVISGDGIPTNDFSKKMLESQTIEGFLTMHTKQMDNKCYLYYDISSKQTMNILYEKNRINYVSMKEIWSNILQTIERTFEYLLSADDFILQPEYIFMTANANKPLLCFVPGYQKNIQQQIIKLLEYFMNKIDYNDKEAVLLVYRLYAISKEEGCTLDQLVQGIVSKELSIPPNTIRQEAVRYNKNSITPINQLHNEILPTTTIDLVSDPASHKEQEVEKSFRKIKEIPAMQEKIEGEEEVLYYPLKVYAFSALSILIAMLIFIVCLISGVLYNSFGRHIDTTKLLAAALILVCGESYLLKIIWDKKNKMTKLVSRQEYVDPRSYTKGKDSIKKAPNTPLIQRIPFSKEKSASKDKNGIEDLQLMKFGGSQHSIGSTLTPEVTYMKSFDQGLSNRDIQGDIKRMQDSVDEEEEATCLLNSPSIELSRSHPQDNQNKKTILILNPLDTNQYQPIPLNSIPFFVGKLKKNVDYCLENEAVSRYHAKIYKEDDQFYICDLNSTNGTFLNGNNLMPYQKVELHMEDEIAFANVKYRFQQTNV